VARYRSPLRCLLGLAVVCSVVSSVSAETTLRVSTDRPDALYACADEVRFVVDLRRDGGPVAEATVPYRLTLDGGRLLGEGELAVRDGRAEVRATLGEPGFVRLSVTFAGEDGNVEALAAAAFDPEHIAPSADEPADFVEFWEQQKAELATIALDPRLEERADLASDQRTVYRISLANIAGTRVYGWLAVPKLPGPHPAVLTVPWAGVYPTPVGLIDWANRGFLAMAISAHDYDADMPEDEYAKLNEGPLKGYPHQGRESRETGYFRRVFLGCVRAVDYLTSRDDWNQASLIVTGSSQGGGLSLVTAGLDDRVTGLAANVPALCDHLGYKAGHQPGWPRLVSEGDAGQEEASGYFDAVHFARHVTCPAIVGVGFIDTTCPPTGIYAAYNVLGGPKQIVATPPMGHSQSEEYAGLLYRWIPEQAGLAGR